jgi:hypothetical protein
VGQCADRLGHGGGDVAGWLVLIWACWRGP